MLTFEGKIENGEILAIEPISDSYEGKKVTIALADEPESENQDGWERLLKVIEENQIDSDLRI